MLALKRIGFTRNSDRGNPNAKRASHGINRKSVLVAGTGLYQGMPLAGGGPGSGISVPGNATSAGFGGLLSQCRTGIHPGQCSAQPRYVGTWTDKADRRFTACGNEWRSHAQPRTNEADGRHPSGALAREAEDRSGNSVLLSQVGTIYHTTHQFKQAADYYKKAVQADPKNIALRTKLASSLYRSGDSDEAIKQLNQALRDDPNDAN